MTVVSVVWSKECNVVTEGVTVIIANLEVART